MTAAEPLPYFTEDPAVPRRTGAVTAVAVIGIVLAALTILAQALGATTPGLPRGSAFGATDVGFVLGRVVRVAFTLIMLVGCAGLLSLRPAARWLVIVAAYAWLIFFTIEALIFVYALSVPRTGQAILSVTAWWALATMGVVSLVSGLAFPLFALVVLRRRDVTRAFEARRTAPPAEVPAFVRATAAFLLAFAALWTLQAAVECLAVTNGVSTAPLSTAGRLFSATARTTQQQVRGPAALLDAALLLLLNGTLALGCLLLLARNRAGGTIVVVCCLAKLALTIAAWNTNPSLFLTTTAAGRRGGVSTMALIYQWLTVLSLQLTGLLWPALVLAIMTYRGANEESPTRAGPVPPPLPPAPVPPPRRPKW